ncbi:hypothetical protein NKH36_05615 [Mesorhizobium sp. M1312]|uniref:hypothetical protein n=1 Tax=unclassified Mesorhizobium TaxID=325217 RepID=UPI003336CCDC
MKQLGNPLQPVSVAKGGCAHIQRHFGQFCGIDPRLEAKRQPSNDSFDAGIVGHALLDHHSCGRRL